MGTIIARKRKDGSTGYTAQILLKRGSAIVHREAKTFDRKPAAASWMAQRERALAKPGGLDGAKVGTPTLADAIGRYLAESEKAIGKTKAQVLRTIKTESIASMQCADITSVDILAFARHIGRKAKPQTVLNYMSHLSAIFAIARPAWGYQLNVQEMRDAQAVGKRLGVTSKSKERSRRPTLEELDRLLTYFARSRVIATSPPMQKIVVFALYSTRRQDEIMRITWADLDEKHSRVMVRDMKNPGDKVGNDQWCELPPEALAVIKTMPRVDERIFPYNGKSVSAAFTRACNMLEIEEVVFHSLRHEGATRLFELGRTIPQVASVTGHRSWQSLKRYTHIRADGDKYADWKWLKAVTASA